MMECNPYFTLSRDLGSERVSLYQFAFPPAINLEAGVLRQLLHCTCRKQQCIHGMMLLRHGFNIAHKDCIDGSNLTLEHMLLDKLVVPCRDWK